MTRLPPLLLGAVVAAVAAAEPPAALPILHPGVATPALAAGLQVVEAEIRRLEARSKTLRGLLEGEPERQQALRSHLDALSGLTSAVLDTAARWDEARLNGLAQALHAALAAYEKPDFKAEADDPALVALDSELRARLAAAHKTVASSERPARLEQDKRRQKRVLDLLAWGNALGRVSQAAALRQAALRERTAALDAHLLILRQQLSALRPAPTPERPAAPRTQ